jgi:hypothetical protein
LRRKNGRFARRGATGESHFSDVKTVIFLAEREGRSPLGTLTPVRMQVRPGKQLGSRVSVCRAFEAISKGWNHHDCLERHP